MSYIYKISNELQNYKLNFSIKGEICCRGISPLYITANQRPPIEL